MGDIMNEYIDESEIDPARLKPLAMPPDMQTASDFARLVSYAAAKAGDEMLGELADDGWVQGLAAKAGRGFMSRLELIMAHMLDEYREAVMDKTGEDL